jgi:hypothetical protein
MLCSLTRGEVESAEASDARRVADTSLPGLRVVRELDAVIAVRGRPAICVSDNGTELTYNATIWMRTARQSG